MSLLEPTAFLCISVIRDSCQYLVEWFQGYCGKSVSSVGGLVVFGKLTAPKSRFAPLVNNCAASSRAVSTAFLFLARTEAYGIFGALPPTSLSTCLIGP